MGLRTFFVQAKSSNSIYSLFGDQLVSLSIVLSYDLMTKRKADVLDFSLQLFSNRIHSNQSLFFLKPHDFSWVTLVIWPRLRFFFSLSLSYLSYERNRHKNDVECQTEQFAKLQLMNDKICPNSNFAKFQVPNGCCFT